MADFDKYAPFLSLWEGGFVNDPDDLGGATNRGVTLRTFRAFYGEDRTVEDLKHITEGQWRRIMKSYWDKVKGDRIERQEIAEMLADWYINSGIKAIKYAQKSLDLDPDGIVGPKTLAALNSDNRARDFLYNSRVAYYRQIAELNPSQRKFLKGWLNRTNKLNTRWDGI